MEERRELTVSSCASTFANTRLTHVPLANFQTPYFPPPYNTPTDFSASVAPADPYAHLNPLQTQQEYCSQSVLSEQTGVIRKGIRLTNLVLVSALLQCSIVVLPCISVGHARTPKLSKLSGTARLSRRNPFSKFCLLQYSGGSKLLLGRYWTAETL
ncbi:hypothetical protein M514_02411 [Trichuris suis]|uniref:Uncharacterized protein n=1 Tax=Trichuris suis TaxID=68888 RepID=A0A085MHN8_9BILA|nr:hypothetical protein M513_02411 [Trichuris suis]KFD64811.1 hypothetical protein M514_02411 [Trichuris suis]